MRQLLYNYTNPWFAHTWNMLTLVSGALVRWETKQRLKKYKKSNETNY